MVSRKKKKQKLQYGNAKFWWNSLEANICAVHLLGLLFRTGFLEMSHTYRSEVALVYFKRNEFNGWKTEKYDNSIMTHRYSVRRWSSPICGHGRQPHRDRAAPTMLSCAAVFAAPSGNLRFFFVVKPLGIGTVS